ncbi:sugar nucleotide-binding protein [Ornithinimicrobium cerasi]|uniref:dTDP-4-dehydrorhamnose reductase n=1 Tax=Ornithinimicrobium cerasi TaxID=2248773 RepID=A0A285VRJ1_9MICO|nr:sugar nucleotide-binding protein [Ornithinimicrobium cerasi]SOC56563.1 dTDP-4-dehydrorhamnose reductase [Ornithinimicrobium cerasi]
MDRTTLRGTWLITGLRGTVAPKVAARVVKLGGEVAAWDREAVPVDDVAVGAEFLAALRPAGILHLGMGAEEWAGRLAAHAAEHRLPFVTTSSVSVFGDAPGDPDGPFRPQDEPTARDDYGSYKARCEQAVRTAYPAAVVARIGWQADPDGLGNNMVAQLAAKAEAAGGTVRASRLWRPATSWMSDTAAALVALATSGRSGTVHLDSNAADGWTFPEIVRYVARLTGHDWTVEEHEELDHDTRLVGDEDLIPPLSARR